jgi:hypothetical protein
MPTTRPSRPRPRKRSAKEELQTPEARFSAIAGQFSRAVPAEMTDEELERTLDEAVEEVRQERYERDQARRKADA